MYDTCSEYMESQSSLNVNEESSLSSLGYAIRISIDPGFSDDSEFGDIGEAFPKHSNVTHSTIASNSEEIREEKYPRRENNDQELFSKSHEEMRVNIMELAEGNPQLALNNVNISEMDCSNEIAATEECSDHCPLNTVASKTDLNVCSNGKNPVKNIVQHTIVSENFNSNLLFQTEKKRYQCEYCEKIFYHKLEKERHSLVHTSKKLFTCDICTKAFPHKCRLLRHMRVHTGEKPFPCDLCNKSFSTKGNLKMHLHIHSGAKPFMCKECGKAFTQKRTLDDHAVVHTGEKTFKCEHCDKTFSRKRMLRQHQKKHSSK